MKARSQAAFRRESSTFQQDSQNSSNAVRKGRSLTARKQTEAENQSSAISRSLSKHSGESVHLAACECQGNLVNMNTYGPASGNEHTLTGRLFPLLQAFHAAIQRASNRPVPELKYSAALPAWCHNIADRLAKTIFKNIIGAAPGGKLDPRSLGRLFGMLLRGGVFFFKEAPALVKRERLLDLSPEQEQRLDGMIGFESLFQIASEQFQKPINNEDELIEAGQAKFEGQIEQVMGATLRVMRFLVNEPVHEQHQFLCGIPEGFIGFLDTGGDFTGRSKRGEMYLLLLMHWPEIAEMQKAQPPKTRRDLLEWLEKLERMPLVGDQRQFNDLCDDIGLDLAPPGHPRKARSR